MPAPIKTIKDFLAAHSAEFPAQNDKLLALDNGQFDIAWTQDRTARVSYDIDVAITRVNADGRAANAGAVVVPKSPVDKAEADGSLATLGTFQIVAYADRANPKAEGSIRLNFYDASSFQARDKAFGKSVLVDGSAGDKYAPEVSLLEGGRLAVAYIDGASRSVKARVYDLVQGGFTGKSVVISTTPTVQVRDATSFDLGLVALDGGGFATSWRDKAGFAHLRILDKDGKPTSGDVALAGVTDKTSLTQLADGTLAVFANGREGIAFTQVDAASGKVLRTVALGETGFDPGVATLDDGRQMVVWTQSGNIVGKMLNADGSADDARFTIADRGSDVLAHAKLAVLADGRVAVSYENDTKGGIYATVLDPREAGVTLRGTNGADQFHGTGFADVFKMGGGNDTVVAGAGNDVIDGGTGADRMGGGKGNDTYHVDNIGDAVREGRGGGIDTVRSSISFTLGDNVEKLTLTGTADLAGYGNALNNVITGNAGDNTLDGLGGADRLAGGAGDDTYLFVTRSDQVVEAKGGGTDSVVVGDFRYALGAGVEVEELSSGYHGRRTVILTGNEFGQSIYGGDGANVLDGKGGADTLFGEKGNDTFAFSAAIGAGNVDHVTRFANVAGEDDGFRLSKSVFSSLAAGTLADAGFAANASGMAQDASDRIVYETDTGKLYYDADGTGSGGRVLFAVIDTLEGKLSATDFLVV